MHRSNGQLLLSPSSPLPPPALPLSNEFIVDAGLENLNDINNFDGGCYGGSLRVNVDETSFCQSLRVMCLRLHPLPPPRHPARRQRHLPAVSAIPPAVPAAIPPARHPTRFWRLFPDWLQTSEM